jgi:hypothetical protein
VVSAEENRGARYHRASGAATPLIVRSGLNLNFSPATAVEIPKQPSKPVDWGRNGLRLARGFSIS